MTEELIWLADALRGLPFWTGYRKSYFYNYPISEAAFVAETCSLIQARLPSRNYRLWPECMYKDILPPTNSNKEEFNQSRSDLVLTDNPVKPKLKSAADESASHIRFVMEVKLASSQFIVKDLHRLHKFVKASDSNVPSFLLVIFENTHKHNSSRLKQFINNGIGIRGPQQIPDNEGYYRVRRTLKAAASFKGKENAYYVCLIEVLQNSGDKVTTIQ